MKRDETCGGFLLHMMDQSDVQMIGIHVLSILVTILAIELGAMIYREYDRKPRIRDVKRLEFGKLPTTGHTTPSPQRSSMNWR